MKTALLKTSSASKATVGAYFLRGAVYSTAVVAFIAGFGTAVDLRAQASANTPAIVPVASRPTAEDTRYKVGPGDVLTILVRKAPELSGAVRVDQRGMIHIPMIESEVFAACKTEGELAAQITNLYLEFKRQPSVEVFVSDFQSRPVAVIGAVNAPGQFRLQRQVRLLELLSSAGGPSPRAGRMVNVIHAGGPNLCKAAQVPSEETAAAQELTLYKLNDTLQGREESNPVVQPGDIVSVPDADLVFVIGHVMSPQAIPLRDKPMTISRAIAMSGGPARDAKTSRIRIVRQMGEGQKKQEIFVDLKAVLKEQALDIALSPNDVIEVPSSTTKTILNTLQGAIAPVLTQLPIRAIP